MRLPLLFLLLSTTITAQAQQVYKCASGGNVVYQSPPCGESQPCSSNGTRRLPRPNQ